MITIKDMTTSKVCPACGVTFEVITDNASSSQQEVCFNCFKRLSLNYVCQKCGVSFSRYVGIPGTQGYEGRAARISRLCKVCYKAQLKEYKCAECGENFTSIKYRPDYCPKCFKHLNSTGEEIRCEVCSTSFLFTEAERRFFYDKNLDPPKKCKDCRG